MSWFANWFDSSYYHILYKNRDEKEAELFIDNLIRNSKLTKGANSLILLVEKADMPLILIP